MCCSSKTPPPAVVDIDDEMQELIDAVMNCGPEEDADELETEQLLTTHSSVGTKYLSNPDPTPEQMQWASGAERAAGTMADAMAPCVADLRRALAVFAGTGSPEEAALSRHAAWCDARRREAAEVASLARRLAESHLRCLAARGVDRVVVDPEAAALTAAMREAMESTPVNTWIMMTPEEVARRAFAVVLRATQLTYKLRWGADGLEGKDGEEAVVRALREREAAAEEELDRVSAVFDATIRPYEAWYAQVNKEAPVKKRPSPETEEEEDLEGPRQRRRMFPAGEDSPGTEY
uniref:Uncharacterized protein n=1 Tax=Leersia perrieri TaxID=77586 RepID=A0A0D9X9V9_9ORYZ